MRRPRERVVPAAPPVLPVPAVALPSPTASPSLAAASGPPAGGASAIGGGAGGGEGGTGTVPAKRGARIANNLLIGVDAPPSVRPFQLKVVFEVDSAGRARILSATHTRDGSYNRTLTAELAQIRFHPATRVDGAAVMDTVALEWDF